MTTDLTNLLDTIGAKARAAATNLSLCSDLQKSHALTSMANMLRQSEQIILKANKIDVTHARAKGLSEAMIDRLVLTPSRIENMASSLEKIAHMNDPVGKIDAKWQQDNGLKFSKVRIPIGVIGMIYESRPNVTADAGALCLKSGNACILRGGSESIHSNKSIYEAMQTALKASEVPHDAIQLIPTTDRKAVGLLLGGLNNNVDMIIPRGGKNLIARVQKEARVPILAHLEGLCHSYVHEKADLFMAKEIIINAKLRRTGVCGSTETLLVDRTIAQKFLPDMTQQLIQLDCEIRGDKFTQSITPQAIPATDEDYYTEHLAPIINIKVVDNLQSAIDHINTYGSGHTDSIITMDKDVAKQFQKAVDSAIVMHNASTQFADGGEFGFGAEIGISTGRLHARGPVGAEHLTTYKYLVHGNGHTRP